MSDIRTIGIVSPGAMGAALARSWRAGGVRAVATIADRSARTRSLARDLELLPTMGDVVGQSDVIVSVVPPGSAVRVAEDVASLAVARGVRPSFLDLNAIAPSTVESVFRACEHAGLPLIDGAISGPPPREGSDTILYLSGPRAERIAELPISDVIVRVVGRERGKASAVKMCTASVYKGFTALLAQALQTADHHRITDVVLADLIRDFPAHVEHAPRLIASAASKSDRFPAEMREIAKAQSEAGASRTLFEAMAEVYETISRSDLANLTPEQAASARDLTVILAELARR